MKRPALESLVHARIDHSGVYPPTALPLHDALAKCAGFHSTLARPAMIGSEIVLGYKELGSIKTKTLVQLGFPSDKLFRICVNAGRALDPAMKTHVLTELEQIIAFNDSKLREPVPQRVISFEIKLDFILTTTGKQLRSVLSEIVPLAESGNFLVFIEPDLSKPSATEDLEVLSAMLNEFNGAGPRLGLKVRLTGPTAITINTLAQAVITASSLGLPFKVTGGLHHPFRSVGNVTGFISLCAAVALTRKYNMPAEWVEQILEDAGSGVIRIGDELSWHEHSISAAEIDVILRDLHFSIGCCDPAVQDRELTRVFP